MNSIIIAIRDIVNKYEPHVIVKEKIIDKVGKKVLVLRDLHVPAALRK
jgi:Cd2+/Zn2+-exporting ATPase